MTEPDDRPAWSEPPRRRPSPGEVLLKMVAGVAILTLLGVVAVAVFFFWAMSSYGSNK